MSRYTEEDKAKLNQCLFVLDRKHNKFKSTKINPLEDKRKANAQNAPWASNCFVFKLKPSTTVATQENIDPNQAQQENNEQPSCVTTSSNFFNLESLATVAIQDSITINQAQQESLQENADRMSLSFITG